MRAKSGTRLFRTAMLFSGTKVFTRLVTALTTGMAASASASDAQHRQDRGDTFGRHGFGPAFGLADLDFALRDPRFDHPAQSGDGDLLARQAAKMVEQPHRTHRGVTAHFHFMIGHEEAQAKIAARRRRQHKGGLVPIRRRHRAHLFAGHGLRVQDYGRRIAAPRPRRENIDAVNLGRGHLPGAAPGELEVSTGRPRLDQSWKEPSYNCGSMPMVRAAKTTALDWPPTWQ